VTERRGGSGKQLSNIVKEKRGYWKLKEEALWIGHVLRRNWLLKYDIE